ncbi:MAG: SusD/RagB family nutrient-binding outer membrane lipoprotein [Parabacteroides sp.]|nr:SusD/RagB family nutrient-binding outer membrane lipoprotein [Parabacteroides sp.]
MKRIYSLALGCAALLATFSCSDDKYTDQYRDPSKTQSVSCPALMVGIWQACNTWMNPVYYRYYVSSTTSGRFSGVIGYTNAKDRFAGAGQGYFNERWKNFYQTLAQYRLLEKTYNEAAESDKQDQYVFYLLGRSVMEEQLYEVLSLWGGCPFSEAGTLGLTGDIAASKPKYDSATDLYKMILNDLDEVNTYLNNNTLTSAANTYLKSEDYVNDGDITLWQKYINSVRLRVATHLASNGDLASDARAVIQSMLSNPGAYPLVDTNNENATVSQSDDAFNFDKDLQNAIENSNYNRMSGFMQRALNANTSNPDPRLEALYDPNWDNEYIGLDPTESVSDQDANMSISTHGTAKYYAALDTSTFTRNPGFPGIWMTAAEVAFMKAEAYANNWASGDAKEAYIDGVKLSTEFYFNLNSTGTYRDALTPPTTAVVEAYAESQWNASNPLKSILTQRWIHHGAIQELEAWNVVRRTGYPELYFKKDPQSTATKLPLERLMYPSDEIDYNQDNLNQFLNGTEDSWYITLPWMKSSWYSVID